MPINKEMGCNAPRERLITESFATYSLKGRFLYNPLGPACRMLAIHGARSNYARLDSLLFPLQARGIGSLSFNLSGHTERSPIGIDQTSLQKNLCEAQRFASTLGEAFDTLLGHSLGGALAMKIAEKFAASIRTLILSGTALYPEAAYAVARYGAAFTQAISQPYGFLDSASLVFLRRFKGNVVLILGQYDGLRAQQHGGEPGRAAGTVEIIKNGVARSVYSPIPAEVSCAIRQAVGSKLISIQLDDCDHRVFQYLAQHPKVAQSLATFLHQHMTAPSTSGDYRMTLDGHLLAHPIEPTGPAFPSPRSNG